MIRELVEFGRRVTKGKNRALKEEPYSIVLIINQKGEFQSFKPIEGVVETALVTEHNANNSDKRPIGIITAKQGHARLLLDKSAEVLGIGAGGNKKHHAFMQVLERYRNVSALKPVFAFYDDENKEGLPKAIAEFEKLENRAKRGNITFMLGAKLILKDNNVRNAIIQMFECDEDRLKTGQVCSICGTSNSPVLDEPHGMVKVPKGQSAGSALVSYNESVFESYGLKGNLNSSICRECARNYIEGLTFLLSDGYMTEGSDRKNNKVSYHQYNHRIKISDTTIVLFWTRRKANEINPFMLYNDADESEVKNLFESVWNGDNRIESVVDSNMFYSCTISSAAARIAVRDWTAISLDDYKRNLADWFHDIEIEEYNGKPAYSSLGRLINATQPDKKSGKQPKSDLNSKTRIGTILWNAAIKGRSYKIPIEIVLYVLNRISVGDNFTQHRVAIIKLIINRNSNKNMKSSLDETNRSLAYLCGRLFAVIELMQWKAMGKVNSGVKERYFAAAVSQPAYILGALLTKNVPIYQHKIGGYLAKELNEIAGIISESGSFPQRFTLIEQGEFALGYYFQRTHKANSENL